MNIQDLTALADSNLNQFSGELKKFKSHHRELFSNHGFDTNSETYKFTNLTRFFEELKSDNAPLSIPESDDSAFVFVDGKLINSPSISGLKSYALTEAELKKLKAESPLSHLHHTFMGHGLVLEVEKNQELSSPVRVLHIVGLDHVSAPTLLIKMGPFSKMTLLEETKSSMVSYAQIGETYAFLNPSSKLEHIQLDDGPASSIHHGSTWAQVDKDANYSNFIFHLNGKLQRRNLDIELNGSGANGESYSLFLTGSHEHSDINTLINHKSPDTTSNQIAKGIIGGEGRGVFTGKIHIHPKSQRVVSGQINRNLLLSKKAQIHSQPQLEIFADDVKCSHGSTTGQLSDEEIFYFETRGIPADKARSLLAFGFGLEVVLKIQDRNARATVESKVMNILKEKFDLGGKA